MQEQAHEDANIIFGASIDETLGENVKVTVIATGFDREIAQAELPAQAAQRLSMAPAASQSFAAVPARLSPSSQAPALRPPRDESHAAFSTRRPAAPAFANGAQQALPMREPIRERMTLPAGMDSEWDTPTFQRKGQ